MLSQHVDVGDTLVSIGFIVLRERSRIVDMQQLMDPSKIAWRPAVMLSVREVRESRCARGRRPRVLTPSAHPCGDGVPRHRR